MSGEAEIPPGCAANPSSWPQRLPIVAVALGGFGIATYLGLYQLDAFASVGSFSSATAAERF